MMDGASIAYTTIDVLIAVAAVSGNALVLHVIHKNTNLQTITNYFVASLAMADLLVGLLGIPAGQITANGLPPNFHGCLLLSNLIIMFTLISIFSLLTIAVERFIAIKNPFAYQEHFTGKVALLIIIISWISGILLALPPVFGWNLGPNKDNICAFVLVIDMRYMVYFNFFGCVLVPLVVIFIIYCYIFKIVRKQMKQIAALIVVSDQANKDQRKNTVSDMKAAKMFAIIILIFAMCWLPINIMNTVTLFGSNVSLVAVNIGILLSHANSAINPFLYAFTNSKFKYAMKKALGMKAEPPEGSVVKSSPSA